MNMCMQQWLDVYIDIFSGAWIHTRTYNTFQDVHSLVEATMCYIALLGIKPLSGLPLRLVASICLVISFVCPFAHLNLSRTTPNYPKLSIYLWVWHLPLGDVTSPALWQVGRATVATFVPICGELLWIDLFMLVNSVPWRWWRRLGSSWIRLTGLGWRGR